MEKVYSKTKLEYINAFLFIFLSFFAACAFDQKLFFPDLILKKEISDFLKHQIPVIIALMAAWYGVNAVLISRLREEKVIKAVYNNICKDIFTKFITIKGPSAETIFRVSIFKAFKRRTKAPFLKVVGRYQIRQPLNECVMKFNSGEGCVGIAYQQANRFVQRNIAEFDPSNPDKYYTESEVVFKLKTKKAKRLNDKACAFLCMPIKFFDAEEPWGVLSIDSVKNVTGFNGPTVREMEYNLHCFSVFLMLQ